VNPAGVLAVTSSWAPRTHKAKNGSTHNFAMKRRGSLSIWFDAGMDWAADPSGKRGRQQAYGDAPILPDLLNQIAPD
jgi:hypothetical protein